MSQESKPSNEEMREEYDIRSGVRGKYYERYKAMTTELAKTAGEHDLLWAKAVNLANRSLALSSGIDSPSTDHWSRLLTVSLNQANLRLNSIVVLLTLEGLNADLDSSIILTRSLFELAINLSYISKDINKRLPQYLRHGGVPLTEEELDQTEGLLAKARGGEIEVKEIAPVRAWKPLRQMCEDLGDQYFKEWETFYRYASMPTHAGSFTIGTSFLRLLASEPPSPRERSTVLVTATAFYHRVVRITAEALHDTLHELEQECNLLLQQLTFEASTA